MIVLSSLCENTVGGPKSAVCWSTTLRLTVLQASRWLMVYCCGCWPFRQRYQKYELCHIHQLALYNLPVVNGNWVQENRFLMLSCACNCCFNFTGFLYLRCQPFRVDGGWAETDVDCSATTVGRVSSWLVVAVGFAAVGFAGLMQVVSWAQCSLIFWYSYHCRSNGKPGGTSSAGPTFSGKLLV